MKSLRVSIINAFFLKVAGALASYGASVIIARAMDVSDVGVFFLVFTVISLVSVLARLGLDQVVLQTFSRSYFSKEESRPILVNAILYFSIIWLTIAFNSVSLVSIFAGFSGDALVFSQSFRTLLPFAFSLGVLAFLAEALRGSHFTGQAHFVQFSFVQILTCILLLLFKEHISTPAIAGAVYSMAGVVGVIFAVVFVARKLELSIRGTSFVPIGRMYANSSFAVYGVVVLTLLIEWLPVIYLGIFAGVVSVAEFTLAARALMVVSFLVGAVNAVVAPRLASQTVGVVRKAFNFSVVVMSSTGIPLLLGIIVFADNVMAVFGSEYVSAAGILAIMAFGQIFNVATGSSGYLLVMRNMHAVYFGIATLALFVLTIGLWIASSTQLTAEGAAKAYATAIACLNILVMWRALWCLREESRNGCQAVN